MPTRLRRLVLTQPWMPPRRRTGDMSPRPARDGDVTDGGDRLPDAGASIDSGWDGGTPAPVCTEENLGTEPDPPSTACASFQSWAESYGSELGCESVPDCPWTAGS